MAHLLVPKHLQSKTNYHVAKNTARTVGITLLIIAPIILAGWAYVTFYQTINKWIQWIEENPGLTAIAILSAVIIIPGMMYLANQNMKERAASRRPRYVRETVFDNEGNAIGYIEREVPQEQSSVFFIWRF